jgi:hypothetical protein
MKSSEFIEKYIRPVVNVMVPPEVQREGELLNATEQIIALGPILELQKIFHYLLSCDDIEMGSIDFLKEDFPAYISFVDTLSLCTHTFTDNQNLKAIDTLLHDAINIPHVMRTSDSGINMARMLFDVFMQNVPDISAYSKEDLRGYLNARKTCIQKVGDIYTLFGKEYVQDVFLHSFPHTSHVDFSTKPREKFEKMSQSDFMHAMDMCKPMLLEILRKG